jgi:hypothetical protein
MFLLAGRELANDAVATAEACSWDANSGYCEVFKREHKDLWLMELRADSLVSSHDVRLCKIQILQC